MPDFDLTENYKEIRLDQIKDEVKEFHPLLMQLFQKLPRVLDVEYTHGTQEFGADIILQRDEEILGNSEYIGIVIKSKPIKQDLAEIIRQIDECFQIPRTFKNGKENIRISTVWVVTNSKIEHNAKVKINSQFASRKVEFVDGSRIKSLIDKYLPSYWSNIDYVIGNFLSISLSKVSSDDEKASLLSEIDDEFYIEQDIYLLPENPKIKRKTFKFKPTNQKIDIFSIIEKEDFILVEGGMGFGKSKLLRKVCSHYLKPEIFLASNIIPILIPFKDFFDKYEMKLENLISALVPKDVIEKFSGGQFLFLIDGFDEKRSENHDRLKQIQELRQDLAKLEFGKILLSTRSLRGLDISTLDLPKSSRLEIQPLSLRSTLQFINRYCKKFNISENILEDIKNSPLFFNLPQSPIAAILLAKLITENSQDIPSNLTELYSKYTELSLGRWDLNKGLQSQKEYEVIFAIIQEISVYSVDNEFPPISSEEVKGFFVNYLAKRNLGITAEELHNKLVSRSDIIFEDQTTNMFTFRHKTFAEFFYAKSKLGAKAISIDQKAFDFYWGEVYFFYLGLIKDAPNEIKMLRELVLENEFSEFIRIVYLGNYMMAAYTTPYEEVIETLKFIALRASNLYLAISSDGSQTFFDNLFANLEITKGQLLRFFKFLIKHSYSFKFFEQAIQEAILRIAVDTHSSDDEKSYAAFFLASISFEKQQDALNLFISNIKNIPMEIRYILLNDSGKKPLDLSQAIKKLNRKTEKALKNANLGSTIAKILDSPIKNSKIPK